MIERLWQKKDKIGSKPQKYGEVWEVAGGDVSIIHRSRWGNHCDCVKMGKSLRFLNPLIEQAIPLAFSVLVRKCGI